MEIVFITQVDVGSSCVILDKSRPFWSWKEWYFWHCIACKEKASIDVFWWYRTSVPFPGCITPVYAAICLRSRCILLSEFCVLVVSCHCVSRPFAWDHDAFCNLYSLFLILYSGYIAPLYAAICNCSNPIPYWEPRWMEGCISGRYI